MIKYISDVALTLVVATTVASCSASTLGQRIDNYTGTESQEISRKVESDYLRKIDPALIEISSWVRIAPDMTSINQDDNPYKKSGDASTAKNIMPVFRALYEREITDEMGDKYMLRVFDHDYSIDELGHVTHHDSLEIVPLDRSEPGVRFQGLVGGERDDVLRILRAIHVNR